MLGGGGVRWRAREECQRLQRRRRRKREFPPCLLNAKPKVNFYSNHRHKNFFSPRSLAHAFMHSHMHTQIHAHTFTHTHAPNHTVDHTPNRSHTLSISFPSLFIRTLATIIYFLRDLQLWQLLQVFVYYWVVNENVDSTN